MRVGIRPSRATGSNGWARARFLSSWVVGLTLAGFAVPRVVDVSWHGVVPVLRSIHWPAALGLVGLWLLGLYVHSFVLTAAAPRLTHRRALALNFTGSAVANVVPLGGAAGVELNRRMMKTWGIDSRSFVGYTFLTNLWDVGSKLPLPILAMVALLRAGESVTPGLRTAALVAGFAFITLVGVAGVVLFSPRGADVLGRTVERHVRWWLRLIGRDRELSLPHLALEFRRECASLAAAGWLRMSVGIAGYVALQWALLEVCLRLTNAGSIWPEALAAFAVERLLTIIPITPGGVGVADLGLVGVLLTLGGDPTGVAAAAVLYRAFVFALEIPVGGGLIGLWLLGQRRAPATPPVTISNTSGGRRIAHVTDFFLPRLGGIETHVDDLVRHQRELGLDARVITPTAGSDDDPAWVLRIPASDARRTVMAFDLVHVHISLWSPYALTVARAAMSAGIPTLVTVHSMWAGAGGILRLAALTNLRRWPVAWSAVSEAAAEAFRRSLAGVDVAVLPNAIDVAWWRPPTASAPSVASHPGQQPVTLVSVMRLTQRKHPMQLLRMFDQVTRLTPDEDVRLVIVGDGPLRRRMERYVQRRGLGRQVRITGRIPRCQVRDELRAASVYVAPAPKESFGIAALEARCAGLPVVAFRRSGVGEFIRDTVDGALVANDGEMFEAIVELVRDGALRARIAAHNRSVVPRFDWVDVLESTDALYEVAVERAGREPMPLPEGSLLAAGA